MQEACQQGPLGVAQRVDAQCQDLKITHTASTLPLGASPSPLSLAMLGDSAWLSQAVICTSQSSIQTHTCSRAAGMPCLLFQVLHVCTSMSPSIRPDLTASVTACQIVPSARGLSARYACLGPEAHCAAPGAQKLVAQHRASLDGTPHHDGSPCQLLVEAYLPCLSCPRGSKRSSRPRPPDR